MSACLHWVILEMILHISSEVCDRVAPNYICELSDPHEPNGRQESLEGVLLSVLKKSWLKVRVMRQCRHQYC